MCLSTIDEESTITEGFGSKEFIVIRGKLYPLYYHNYDVPIPIDQWIDSADYSDPKWIECGCSWEAPETYPAGWHSYLDLHMAKQRWSKGSPYNIEFKHILATGTQWGEDSWVVVHRLMRVLPENEIVIEYC